MFERLTNRTKYGVAYTKIPVDKINMVDIGECYAGDTIDRLTAYEDTGLTPEECAIIAKSYPRLFDMVDELERYREAEREGRLVVLPCKVGDMVYVNSGCLFYHDDAPYTPCEVVVIKATKRETSMHLRPLCESAAGTRYHLWFGISSIGKTVFLTREEAEAALKEQAK